MKTLLWRRVVCVSQYRIYKAIVPPAKVYNFLKYNLNKFVNLFPQVYKSLKVIEGEEGHVGNVKLVEYVISGQSLHL